MVSKVRLVLLTVAIAIVFSLFWGYGISTFYPQPNYNDFCDRPTPGNIETENECLEAGGKWNPYDELSRSGASDDELNCRKISEDNDNLTLICRTQPSSAREGWCNLQHFCSQEYNDARDSYNRNVFIITLVIGLIGLLTGSILLKVESVGAGLMGGSLLTMVYGTLRYWGDAPDVLRFTLLGIVLATLIWIGHYKLNPKK